MSLTSGVGRTVILLSFLLLRRCCSFSFSSSAVAAVLLPGLPSSPAAFLTHVQHRARLPVFNDGAGFLFLSFANEGGKIRYVPYSYLRRAAGKNIQADLQKISMQVKLCRVTYLSNYMDRLAFESRNDNKTKKICQ